MGFLDSIKRAFARPQPAAAAAPGDVVQSQPEPEEMRVPEVTPDELLAGLHGDDRPFLLDIREPHERRQGYIPDNLHIPMNSLPFRLAELPREADIVVYCAHGNRSYSVAGWLIEQGYNAASLRGGIAEWGARGGEIRRE